MKRRKLVEQRAYQSTYYKENTEMVRRRRHSSVLEFGGGDESLFFSGCIMMIWSPRGRSPFFFFSFRKSGA